MNKPTLSLRGRVHKLRYLFDLNYMLHWQFLSRLCRSCDGADSLCSALSAKMNDLKTKYARKKAAVGVASACDKSNPRLCDYGRVICCTGWSKIMSICTRKWLRILRYFGFAYIQCVHWCDVNFESEQLVKSYKTKNKLQTIISFLKLKYHDTLLGEAQDYHNLVESSVK